MPGRFLHRPALRLRFRLSLGRLQTPQAEKVTGVYSSKGTKFVLFTDDGYNPYFLAGGLETRPYV